MNTPTRDDLDGKLNAWEVNPSVPVSFKRNVWQQIAARQAAHDEAFWPRLSGARVSGPGVTIRRR